MLTSKKRKLKQPNHQTNCSGVRHHSALQKHYKLDKAVLTPSFQAAAPNFLSPMQSPNLRPFFFRMLLPPNKVSLKGPFKLFSNPSPLHQMSWSLPPHKKQTSLRLSLLPSYARAENSNSKLATGRRPLNWRHRSMLSRSSVMTGKMSRWISKLSASPSKEKSSKISKSTSRRLSQSSITRRKLRFGFTRSKT